MAISTTYGPDSSTTRAEGPVVSGGGGPDFSGGPDFFRTMVQRRLPKPRKPKPEKNPAFEERRQDARALANMSKQALLARQLRASEEAQDASIRGAAMRPVGLGPAMIPGMGVDPNLLPTRMRPEGSAFQVTPENEAQASLRAREEAISNDKLRADRARFNALGY